MKSNKSNGQLTAQINMGDHKKSGFDLSNNVLGTGKIGRIIPTRALHVMPGDTIKADSKVAVQFEPLAVPILANMDVKQEHFYVPYNVVWKNWDKFISGGEKMDYQGVVPNVTIRKMLDTLDSMFQFSSFTYRGNVSLAEENNGYTGYSSPFLDTVFYSNMQQTLDTLGDTYYIKDLLQPQFKVLELLKNFTWNLRSSYDHTYSFVIVSNGVGENTLQTRTIAIQNYMDAFGLNGNKYIEEIKDYLVEQLEFGSLVLPTGIGFGEIDLLYEFIKPFVGLGSNVDYLNMCRFTLTELLVTMINNMTTQYNIGDDAIASQVIPLSLGSIYTNTNPLSILNLRANYNIWYNNYRDILLEANAFEPYDGDNITPEELFILLIPRQRCWEKDAFTTALDNPGTGNVGVPVTRRDSVSMDVTKVNMIDGDDRVATEGTLNDMEIAEVTFNGTSWRIPTAYLSGQNPLNDDSGNLFDGFSLHALDAAQRAQKWLQKALYFGNRISDFYYMRFGVRFLDARLRLPELLTSSSELVKLDVVMNNTNITTEANGEVFRSIAGDRAAYASAYDNGNSFDRFCEEHGVIMSYLTIMPQITYAFGINRDYSRLDQFDFAFAEFATLGMDAVYDTEITATSLNNEDVKVFGYQGRYYDYKAKHSEEHGELLDSQDMYTFARKFNMINKNGRPKLNYEFVHCFPSLDMFVVDSPLADLFRYDIRHSTAAERELPSQSIYI